MPLLARRSPVPALLATLCLIALILGLGVASPTGPLRFLANPAAEARENAAPAPEIGERVASKRVSMAPALVPSQAGARADRTLSPESLPPAPAPKKPRPKTGPGYQLTGPVIDKKIDCTKLKCVALTFDDGPGPRTPEVIEALKKADAKATFFVLGQQVEAFPATLKQAAAAGMEIGNHTWDHPQLSRTKDKQVNRQIERTQAAVKKASGVTPLYLRPPYGDLSTKQHQSMDMPLAFWDVDTLDWKTRSTRLTVRSAANARPGDIVLMHDIHSSTVDAVPQIVKKLKKRGFTLVTLSTLIGQEPPAQVGYGAPLRKGTKR